MKIRCAVGTTIEEQANTTTELLALHGKPFDPCLSNGDIACQAPQKEGKTTSSNLLHGQALGNLIRSPREPEIGYTEKPRGVSSSPTRLPRTMLSWPSRFSVTNQELNLN